MGAEHRVPTPTPQPGSAKALGVKWRRGGAGAQGQGQGQGQGREEAGATGLSRGAHECDWELECEMVWEPLFSAAGAPLHEGYHVWAVLHGVSGSQGEGAGSGRDQVQQQGRQGQGQGQGTADGLAGSTSSGSSNSSPDSWDAVAEKGPAKAAPSSFGPGGTEERSDATSGGTLPLEGPDSPHWIKVSWVRVWRSVGLSRRREEGGQGISTAAMARVSVPCRHSSALCFVPASIYHGPKCVYEPRRYAWFVQPCWLNLRMCARICGERWPPTYFKLFIGRCLVCIVCSYPCR